MQRTRTTPSGPGKLLGPGDCPDPARPPAGNRGGTSRTQTPRREPAIVRLARERAHGRRTQPQPSLHAGPGSEPSFFSGQCVVKSYRSGVSLRPGRPVRIRETTQEAAGCPAVRASLSLGPSRSNESHNTFAPPARQACPSGFFVGEIQTCAGSAAPGPAPWTEAHLVQTGPLRAGCGLAKVSEPCDGCLRQARQGSGPGRGGP